MMNAFNSQLRRNIEMKKVGIFVLIFTSICSGARGACYQTTGCDAPEGQNPLEYWSHPVERCTNCRCELQRVDIATCSEFFYSTKKSTVGQFVEKEEEQEVLKEDAESVECTSTLSFEYDPDTQELVMPAGLTHVTYFYYDTTTHCCSTSYSYGNVPPGCMEVYEDECTSSIVREDDPTQPCGGPIFFTG